MSREWKQALHESLRQQRILSEPAALRLAQQDAAPWFMDLLSGLAAWLAALLLIVSLLFTFIDDSPLGVALASVLLLGSAVWLLCRPGAFVSQLGLALSLVGQGMLVMSVSQLALWSSYPERPPAVVAALVAIGMLLVPASAVHRLACALIVMAGVAVFIGFNGLLALYGVLLATLATGIWLLRSRWAGNGLAGLWRAAAGAATVAALVLPMLGDRRWADRMIELVGAEIGLWWMWLHPVGAGLLLLAVTGYLLRGQRAEMRLSGLGAALLLIVPGFQAPGLLVAAALWLAVFHAADRLWCVVVGLGAALYLGDFYYSLHISLLQKSGLLVASGIVLLALRWFLSWRWGEADEG